MPERDLRRKLAWLIAIRVGISTLLLGSAVVVQLTSPGSFPIEPLFLLYSQIGRAAENQNANVPPFYEQIGSNAVNYYFYLAALMAFQDPALMSKLTDADRDLRQKEFPLSLGEVLELGPHFRRFDQGLGGATAKI